MMAQSFMQGPVTKLISCVHGGSFLHQQLHVRGRVCGYVEGVWLHGGGGAYLP